MPLSPERKTWYFERLQTLIENHTKIFLVQVRVCVVFGFPSLPFTSPPGVGDCIGFVHFLVLRGVVKGYSSTRAVVDSSRHALFPFGFSLC